MGVEVGIVAEPNECSLLKLIDTVKNSAESHFCFILSAGASVSSGINSDTTITQAWLDKPEEFALRTDTL
jgi:hypothetical protein